jgi:hypothetical protein
MSASSGRENAHRNSLNFGLGRLLNLIIVLILLFSSVGGMTASARSSNVGNNNSAITSGLADQKAAASRKNAPLAFIQNMGQFDKQTLYEVRGQGATLFLAEDAIWFTYVEPIQPDPKANPRDQILSNLPGSPNSTQQKSRKGVNLKVFFPGANPHPTLQPFGKIETHTSYFIGRDSSKWQTDVPVWSGVRYVDIYPGADLESV